MKKRYLLLIVTAVCVMALTACGTSDEKLVEATQARDALIEARQSAEDTYLDITDSSLRDKLDELSEEVTEIEALNLEKVGDDKVEQEILPRIHELTGTYQSLQKGLSTTLEKETAEREEADKHSEVDCYFINKTGMNIKSIVLHDITADTYSDNFLGGDVNFKAGYTLMGTALDIYADSSEWEFVVTDEFGTEYSFSCESLIGKEMAGASIVLTYDSAAGTGDASLGAYEGAAPSEESAPAEETPDAAETKDNEEQAADSTEKATDSD